MEDASKVLQAMNLRAFFLWLQWTRSVIMPEIRGEFLLVSQMLLSGLVHIWI